jgi:hypothetical protein
LTLHPGKRWNLFCDAGGPIVSQESSIPNIMLMFGEVVVKSPLILMMPTLDEATLSAGSGQD